MPLVNRFTRFAASKRGRKVDLFLVRWTGVSLVNVLFSRMTKSQYNKPLLLTTIGAKTGLRRTVVLPYFEFDGRFVIVGSRGGLPTDPMWARNIKADPHVWIRVNRKLRPAAAQLAEGVERARLWSAITAREKVYLAYQKRALPHRELPVFVLTAES